MKSVLLWGVVSGLCLAQGAQAAEGLVVSGDAWPRWQARLSVGTSTAGMPGTASAEPASQVVAASLLGDYYFSTPRLGTVEARSGFRATSGLLYGGAWGSLSGAAVGGSGSSGLGLARQNLGSAPLGVEAVDNAALPYLGLGYTRVSQGGWGVSADIGLVAQSPGSAWRLGRALFGPSRGLDDAVRDLRLTPLIQLGVRYRF